MKQKTRQNKRGKYGNLRQESLGTDGPEGRIVLQHPSVGRVSIRRQNYRFLLHDLDLRGQIDHISLVCMICMIYLMLPDESRATRIV